MPRMRTLIRRLLVGLDQSYATCLACTHPALLGLVPWRWRCTFWTSSPVFASVTVYGLYPEENALARTIFQAPRVRARQGLSMSRRSTRAP
jgi:hypothetical protein